MPDPAARPVDPDLPPLSDEEVAAWAEGIVTASEGVLLGTVARLAREVQASRRAAQSSAPLTDRAEGRDVHVQRCHSPSCPCFLDGRAAQPAREGVARWKGQDWRVVVQYAFSPPEVVRNADGIVATLRPLSGDPDE